jgi:3-oxoadipate enol-lactonase
VGEVSVGGGRLSYSVEGDARVPVLLLSNALGTTRELWRPQVEAWAASWRVVRYDTRGHGRSTLGADGCSLDRLGADALAILDDLGVARAHVAGLSLGGLTAMWLALHAPDRVDRLVLANTAARIGSHEIWASRITQVRGEGLAAVAEAAPSRWFTADFARRRPDAVSTFQSMLRGIDPDGYTACAAVLRDADLRDEVARISRPVLVISGRLDPLTTPADAELLCARIAGARACPLDAAHLSNVEAAPAFTAAVAAFLAA